MKNAKIVLPGGAGLVGQNLVSQLRDRGYRNIVVIDKHQANLDILSSLHPHVTVVCADLAEPGDWQRCFIGGDAVVMLQAQIGGNDYQAFLRNNVQSTRLVLNSIKANDIPYLVHVSSSVVESAVDDFYSTTKREQEQIVLESGIPGPTLRPTLMFGWFDRKHLGWLSRFMKMVPVFPIPGTGRYVRQPLYAGDFANMVTNCIDRRMADGIYNISGYEKVNYIDIVRAIKKSTRSRAVILPIPYRIFYALLWLWGVFDKNPAFTTQQLSALVVREEFEVIDWPGIFGVQPTPFEVAIHNTFNDPRYSAVVLEF